MKSLVLLVVLVTAAWYGYSQHQLNGHDLQQVVAPLVSSPATQTQFACDGRIYCSQMTSCAEATYFLRNCPGTKMDGNNDGVPCEKQWCK